MSPIVISLIVAVLILAAVIGFLVWRNSSSRRLKSRFGPEYQHTIEESGDRRAAEDRLRRRVERVRSYAIHPLAPEQRARFVSAWRGVQADFVDDPREATAAADRLLGEIMSARGYPVLDFEQAAADLSVDHPVVVQNYRAGHAIALRHSEGKAGTEELRQAMMHYRALFDDLAAEPRMRAAS